MRDIQKKRYFGMTVIQLAVLGCLAFVALGTVLGGGIFITTSMRDSGSSVSLSPTPELTATPSVTDTPAPTPTETPIPYEELIPSGWNQHITPDIEIWLPVQFKAVNIEKERKDRIDFYQELGHDEIARDFEENPSAYMLWFKGTETSTTPYIANITIEFESMNAENLDVYLDQEYPDGTSLAFRVVNRKGFQVGGYEARRVLLESSLSDIYIGVAQYAIYDGTRVFLINCSSHFSEFYTWLPEFDKVARTFRLVGQ
jgi:hypothetical protein